MSKNKELTVEIADEEIRISIGLKLLAFAVENGPDWYEEYKVDDSDNYAAFGQAILKYLNSEEEDGSTPVHRMFDSVADEALNQGEDGFIENEDFDNGD